MTSFIEAMIIFFFFKKNYLVLRPYATLFQQIQATFKLKRKRFVYKM